MSKVKVCLSPPWAPTRSRSSTWVRGLIRVIRQHDANHYEVVERVATAPGARTGLSVPPSSTLYVAVPSRDGALAEIGVFYIRWRINA